MDTFRPMQFGARTFIVPWNQDLPEAAQREDAAIIRLDPGLAFGTGTHPTTALCLQWLDAQALAGKTVLDFGCGSGVLAIAALKLGAASAVGVDNDPQALIATHDNAQRNAVDAALTVFAPADEPAAAYDIVVANILAIALDALAPLLAARTRSGGRIALSGILAGQEQDLLQRYDEWFHELRVEQQEDWIRIDGRRR
jgi:ribosomal protein L11 methyltransferase